MPKNTYAICHFPCLRRNHDTDILKMYRKVNSNLKIMVNSKTILYHYPLLFVNSHSFHPRPQSIHG